MTGDEGFSPEVLRQLDLLMAGTDHGDPGLSAAMRRELGERLAEGRPLRVYLGLDPTSPHVHLGHGVQLTKLALFQELGHHVIFLIGDFTARIGDPTGRSATRPPLTTEQIAANAATYAEQAFRIMDPDRTELLSNSEWLGAMGMADVIRLASSMTLAQMLVRDDFRKRFEDGTPIRLHEFLYALLQGEDAAHLETDVQVGGTDQLFNILAGREIMKAQGQRPQVIITCPLLVGTDGALKMSKSYGNDIGIAIDPADMYGKLMSLPDTAMADYWRLASGLPPDGVAEAIEAAASGAWHPRDAKMKLAHRIVSRWHGGEAAGAAEEAFVQQFQRRELPDEIPLLTVPADAASLIDLLMATAIPKSRGEARRLVQGGGVSIDGARLADANALPDLPEGAVLKVGKRHLFRLAR